VQLSKKQQNYLKIGLLVLGLVFIVGCVYFGFKNFGKLAELHAGEFNVSLFFADDDGAKVLDYNDLQSITYDATGGQISIYITQQGFNKLYSWWSTSSNPHLFLYVSQENLAYINARAYEISDNDINKFDCFKISDANLLSSAGISKVGDVFDAMKSSNSPQSEQNFTIIQENVNNSIVIKELDGTEILNYSDIENITYEVVDISPVYPSITFTLTSDGNSKYEAARNALLEKDIKEQKNFETESIEIWVNGVKLCSTGFSSLLNNNFSIEFYDKTQDTVIGLFNQLKN